MPEIPDTEELEALITALIRKASDRLQQQLDEVQGESVAQDQAQDLTPA